MVFITPHQSPDNMDQLVDMFIHVLSSRKLMDSFVTAPSAGDTHTLDPSSVCVKFSGGAG